LAINVATKQRMNNPYREAVTRTEFSGFRPSRLNRAAGNKSDLPETYKPAPKFGKSSAGLPRAVQFATWAYVPSSGPNTLGVLGKDRKTTTLTTNEAMTIAYNLLFKVVNLNLKSFIVLFPTTES